MEKKEELKESFNNLFSNVASMVKFEVQGTNNTLELLEKMNLKVAREYQGLGDLSSRLRVFIEPLKSKPSTFDHYVHHIDAIENQLTHFEAIISMLEQYVSFLESQILSIHQPPPSN